MSVSVGDCGLYEYTAPLSGFDSRIDDAMSRNALIASPSRLSCIIFAKTADYNADFLIVGMRWRGDHRAYCHAMVCDVAPSARRAFIAAHTRLCQPREYIFVPHDEEIEFRRARWLTATASGRFREAGRAWLQPATGMAVFLSHYLTLPLITLPEHTPKTFAIAIYHGKAVEADARQQADKAPPQRSQEAARRKAGGFIRSLARPYIACTDAADEARRER